MRWGVLATGKISSDFCNAILHDEQADVVGIGSRSIESANRFSERHGLLERGVKCYGSYEELLKDPQVDVVYVGSINTSHFTNVIACLQHGKHVLCEKPLGVNLAQVKQMIELAKEKKLFLGEGMWTRSFPAAQKVRDILSSKVLGEVVTCQGDLGFDIPPSVSRCYDLHQVSQ
jgi:predicted dehydrogenase